MQKKLLCISSICWLDKEHQTKVISIKFIFMFNVKMLKKVVDILSLACKSSCKNNLSMF